MDIFPPHVIELGHYEAKSNGGKNSDFVALCSGCNRRQMNTNAQDFFNETTIQALNKTLASNFTEFEVFTALVELVELEFAYVKRCNANLNISEACKRAIAQKQYKTFAK